MKGQLCAITPDFCLEDHSCMHLIVWCQVMSLICYQTYVHLVFLDLCTAYSLLPSDSACYPLLPYI